MCNWGLELWRSFSLSWKFEDFQGWCTVAQKSKRKTIMALTNSRQKGAIYLKSTGLLRSLRKFSIIKVAVILAMSIKLHFVQLCKIWAKSDNLHFSLFHGVPPLQIFGFAHKMSVHKNPKICKGGDPMKKGKMKVVRFGSNFAQLYKMQFYAQSQNYSNFYYWKLSEGPLITLSISNRLPPF